MQPGDPQSIRRGGYEDDAGIMLVCPRCDTEIDTEDGPTCVRCGHRWALQRGEIMNKRYLVQTVVPPSTEQCGTTRFPRDTATVVRMIGVEGGELMLNTQDPAIAAEFNEGDLVTVSVIRD